MSYQTAITKKGQITIPKEARDLLALNRFKKVFIELERDKKELIIKPSYDFVKIARKVKVKKKIDPVKARERLESSYERR